MLTRDEAEALVPGQPLRVVRPTDPFLGTAAEDAEYVAPASPILDDEPKIGGVTYEPRERITVRFHADRAVMAVELLAVDLVPESPHDT